MKYVERLYHNRPEYGLYHNMPECDFPAILSKPVLLSAGCKNTNTLKNERVGGAKENIEMQESKPIENAKSHRERK